MTAPVDLRAIRKVAEAALGPARGKFCNGVVSREQWKMVLACDPQTVLRMVAVCEAAQRLLTWTGDGVADAIAFKDLQSAVRALGDARSESERTK